MKQVFLSYRSGYTFSAYAIKYFVYNYNTYFIYTLKEIDEKGYIKLYMVKIMDELGEKVSQTVRKVDEWDKMKLIIKRLIDEIRVQNIQNFKILDINELNGLTINENREFKLSQDLVEILSKEIIDEEKHNDVLSELLIENPIVSQSKGIESNIPDIPEMEILDIEKDGHNLPISSLDETETKLSEEETIEVLEL